MSGMLQESSSTQEHDSSRWIIFIAVALVFIFAVVGALLLRERPKALPAPHPYAASVKISDIKMSTSQNFVGTTVTYIDGMVTNSSDKTVTRAVVHIVFRDSMGQVTQADDLPLRALQTSGPYPDVVDLPALTPGQSQQFRLTFEHVSSEWNQAYPELQVTDVTVK